MMISRLLWQQNFYCARSFRLPINFLLIAQTETRLRAALQGEREKSEL